MPEPGARERVVELVAGVQDRAQNVGGALGLRCVDERVGEQNRVAKPLERVAAPLGVGERFLEDAGSSLQLAQLRVRAAERICDRERSLRMCLGGFLEQRHRPARVADRVGDLAEAGEGSRPQRPILRIERRREESLGLQRVAEPERDLRVQQRVGRRSGKTGCKLVGVGAETAPEPAEELERRDALSFLEPRHVRRRADAARERTLAQSCPFSRLTEPPGQSRRRVDMVRLLAGHFSTIGTSL